MTRRNFVLASTFSLLPGCRGASAADSLAERRSCLGKGWRCCRIDPVRLPALEVFWAGADGNPLRSFAALETYVAGKGRRALMVMNAGMFEADGSPTGWCVAEGTLVAGPNLKDGAGNFFLKPNGVFGVTGGKAVIAATEAALPLLKGARCLTQSGPILLTDGQEHPAFRRDSPNRNIRNGVGVTADGTVWLAISTEEVTFHETASLFADLGCADALYLDGAVSRMEEPSPGGWQKGVALGPLLALTAPAA